MELLEIELLTDELSQTEDFYSSSLGLEILTKEQNSISFKAGNSVLKFSRSNNLKPVYHFAFNIPNNQLEEAMKWVLQTSAIIKSPEGNNIIDFKNWDAKAFYFYDNNGNILEFIARYNLSNQKEDPFDHTSILSISEIGIVTDDVNELTDQLIKENNLSVFSKQPRRETFNALGDDNGLLIISQTQRHWYPTDQPCHKYFSKIKISQGNTVRTIIVN